VYYDLPDGTRVLIRPIEPGDKSRLADGLRRLSEETIRRRFLAAKPRFSATELRYLTEVDGKRHAALVGVLAGDPETLIAVARYVALPGSPDTAEIAVVVGDPFQGRGLGRRMTELLADEARASGIRRFAATMLADNRAALRLMGTFARRLERSGHGPVRDYVADLVA
jgi:RimJ/RimL family protein N-acetyltransferase